MKLSRALVGVITASPALGRLLLRHYLRVVKAAPERSRWVVEDLKRRLVPAMPQRRVRIDSGIYLEVDLTSAIGREIYYHGSYEPELADFLRRSLEPGMVFIDAGANLGEFSLRAARLVGPTGRVFALEASPETARHLERNVQINRLRNVRVIQAALCEAETPQAFHLGRGRDSGSSSLSPPHDYMGETLTVDGVRLDLLALRESLTRVDCIKLDVEGAELMALRGATALLSGPNPPVIVFEYNPDVSRRAGWGLSDIGHLLGGFGYSLHYLGRNGIGVRVTTTDRNCNVVALPRDHRLWTGRAR
jgi:FkbM family methyltransferase